MLSEQAQSIRIKKTGTNALWLTNELCNTGSFWSSVEGIFSPERQVVIAADVYEARVQDAQA
jgi:hypothetical protein